MGEIEGVILMSPRTAAVYATLMRKHGLASVARGLIHFCLSRGGGAASGAAGRRPHRDRRGARGWKKCLP